MSLAYHSVGVEPEGAARELAGAGVGGEGRAVRQRGPHEVRVAEQRDVPVLVVRGDRRGVADDEDVGAVAAGLLLLLLLLLLRDERQDLLPEVDQDDLLGSKRRTTMSATGTTPEADRQRPRPMATACVGVRTYVEERDAAAVGGAHQLVPVPRVPLPVGGLERGQERLRLRRRRERQQLLPEHEVLPHPALDDLGEPTAHGEAQRVPVRAAAGVEGV